MTQTQARYDGFAERYEEWSSDMPPLSAAQGRLLPAVIGDRVVDIGCGQGRLSRQLAGLGAVVTGVDVLLAIAGPGGGGQGKVTAMSRPPWGRGLAVRAAPWASAMAATMARPRPCPSPWPTRCGPS